MSKEIQKNAMVLSKDRTFKVLDFQIEDNSICYKNLTKSKCRTFILYKFNTILEGLNVNSKLIDILNELIKIKLIDYYSFQFNVSKNKTFNLLLILSLERTNSTITNKDALDVVKRINLPAFLLSKSTNLEMYFLNNLISRDESTTVSTRDQVKGIANHVLATLKTTFTSGNTFIKIGLEYKLLFYDIVLKKDPNKDFISTLISVLENASREGFLIFNVFLSEKEDIRLSSYFIEKINLIDSKGSLIAIQGIDKDLFELNKVDYSCIANLLWRSKLHAGKSNLKNVVLFNNFSELFYSEKIKTSNQKIANIAENLRVFSEDGLIVRDSKVKDKSNIIVEDDLFNPTPNRQKLSNYRKIQPLNKPVPKDKLSIDGEHVNVKLKEWMKKYDLSVQEAQNIIGTIGAVSKNFVRKNLDFDRIIIPRVSVNLLLYFVVKNIDLQDLDRYLSSKEPDYHICIVFFTQELDSATIESLKDKGLKIILVTTSNALTVNTESKISHCIDTASIRNSIPREGEITLFKSFLQKVVPVLPEFSDNNTWILTYSKEKICFFVKNRDFDNITCINFIKSNYDCDNYIVCITYKDYIEFRNYIDYIKDSSLDSLKITIIEIFDLLEKVSLIFNQSKNHDELSKILEVVENEPNSFKDTFENNAQIKTIIDDKVPIIAKNNSCKKETEKLIQDMLDTLKDSNESKETLDKSTSNEKSANLEKFKKLHFVCPICRKGIDITVSLTELNKKLSNSKGGLYKMFFTGKESEVCNHNFIAYVDLELKVRGYESFDGEAQEVSPELRERLSIKGKSVNFIEVNISDIQI